ncbi:MAG: hypothetical protein RR313_10300 [Anaerovoracaceae bacterium]
MDKREKLIKYINIIKMFSFVFGYIMFFVASNSFGDVAGVVLGVVATVGFWWIIRNEQTRLIGESIASEIKMAISEEGNIDNFIEIKRIKKGLIARVYLVNARERSAIVHKAIAYKLERSKYKKYLWVMQLTDMTSEEDLGATQKLLNSELIEELMKKHKGDKK